MPRSLIMIALVCALSPAVRAADKVDFGREIRPILSDMCFACHGPDPKARKGELRLDTREFAMKGGDSGLPALIPTNAGPAPLIERILSHDANEMMPPPKAAKRPNKAQIDLIERWVAEGGEYSQHWGFVAPIRPALPAVKDVAWVRSPIDAFVLARLEKEGLPPAKPADKATLIRRLSLDLVGLPPSPEEIDAFVADQSPNATEKVIDRLLASPHYGEKWGRQWLDAARYADSDGFEKDKPRSVWAYRDWVIRALNRDLPYNHFITEQLAGDLLPNATQDQKVATGFLRNSMINEEGGVDPEQFRMEAMFDRMDAIGKGMLGVTLQCAQCHTHKFDPITHEDYYKVFAYLNDTHEASIPTFEPADMAKRAAIVLRVHELEADLKHRVPDWAARMVEWEEMALAASPEWTRLAIANAGDNSQRYVTHADRSVTAWGYAPTKWTSTFSAPLKQPKPVTALRLDMLTDPELPLNGPGRSPTGLFALSEFSVEVAPANEPNKRTRVKFISARADFADAVTPLERMYDDKSGKHRVTGPVELAIDGDDMTAWGADLGPGRRNADHAAVFVPAKPIDASAGVIFTFGFRQNHGGWNSDDNQNNNLGRFAVSVADAPPTKSDPLPDTVLSALKTPAEKRTLAQVERLFSRYRLTVPQWAAVNEEIATLWATHPEPTAQLTVASRKEGRPTFMLERGDFLKPSKQVTAGTPAFLNPLPKDAPPNRLGLAMWLTDRNAPTTARSLVNRVWQSYFGTGLVPSAEDLGTQSETPSHPQLFDWLAVEFMEGGWSQKKLHKLIAMSNTYQQASKITPEMRQRDPLNRLLARGPRFRVEGETVRDIALAASGLISLDVGGPPVYPPAPAFLFQPPTSYGPKVWDESTGPERYRRAVYTFRFRSVPYPVLANFDTPNADASCVKRPRSNTPLQALTTLNEVVFMECARALAMKAMREVKPDDASRAAFVFRRCTGRIPEASEVELLTAFVAKEQQKFAAPGAEPWQLAANDPAHPPELPKDITPAQLAAWTAAARLVLNLDETITKQ